MPAAPGSCAMVRRSRSVRCSEAVRVHVPVAADFAEMADGWSAGWLARCVSIHSGTLYMIRDLPLDRHVTCHIVALSGSDCGAAFPPSHQVSTSSLKRPGCRQHVRPVGSGCLCRLSSVLGMSIRIKAFSPLLPGTGEALTPQQATQPAAAACAAIMAMTAQLQRHAGVAVYTALLHLIGSAACRW